MELQKFVKNRQMGEGRTRVINAEGKVIAEHFDDYGVLLLIGLAPLGRKNRNETKTRTVQPRYF